MALKDWKKIGPKQWVKSTTSFNTPYMISIDGYSKFPPFTIADSYDVKVWSMSENILYKKKASSLKLAKEYVKSYMRSH